MTNLPTILLAATDVATAITVIANVVLVIVTAVYVSLTHQLLRAQTVPCIVVYAQNRPDLEMRRMIEIVIENIGNGVARDVRFRLSEKIPCRFLGNGEWMNEGPLIEGISALCPRQKRVMLWGIYDELHEKIGDRKIQVTATFYSVPAAQSEAEGVESILEIASLKHDELRFDDGTWACAKYLREIKCQK